MRWLAKMTRIPVSYTHLDVYKRQICYRLGSSPCLLLPADRSANALRLYAGKSVSFLGVSKKVDTAVGMGIAVTFVMGLASAVCYAVNEFVLVRFGLEYMPVSYTHLIHTAALCRGFPGRRYAWASSI